jgi:hypothetical protein
MKRTASIIGAALLMVGASALSASADPSASTGGSAAPGYNAIPAHVSGNVPSVGFEAYSYKEFGDEVGLSGQARTLGSMSVLFSSWGCQSGSWFANNCVTTPGATFDVPITFNVYADDVPTGTPLATLTQTVAFAYRPSASALCTGANVGKWYNKTDKTCYNGLPQTVKMAMPNATLPDNVIWTVQYNTSHYGPTPIGESAPCYTTSGGCGYDSLNVGINSFPNAPFSGTDINADQVFVWYQSAPAGVLEDGWIGYRPLGQITTQ